MSVATRRPTRLPAGGNPESLPGVARRWGWWAPLVAVTVIGIVRLAVHLGEPFSSGGDVAFLELQLRHTLHGVVGVGPYSRFGWHDPGPAMFYLFAPLYWVTGESSRSLFASSWLLNMGSGLVAVLLIRRRAGALAAWITVSVLMVFVWAVGFDQLIDPWNPSLSSLPMLLVAVSAAASADGDAWGLAALAASTTFAVQTYIATIPDAAAFSVVGFSGFMWHWLRSRSSPDRQTDAEGSRINRRRAGMAAIASLVALAWALPIAQQIHGNPGNLGLLWNFEVHPPASAGSHHHALYQAVGVVSDYTGVLGMGEPTDIAFHWSRVALATVYLLAGVAGALWWSRRNRFMAALAATTPVGIIAAVAAGTRVTGPIYSYMFWWCRVLPVPMLIALGTATARTFTTWATRQRTPVWLAGLGAAAVAGATVLALRTTVSSPSVSFHDSPGARLAAHEIEAAVGSPHRAFTLQITDPGFSDGPLILTLAKDGYRFHLTPEMDLYGGDTHQPSSGLTFTISHGNSPFPTVQADDPLEGAAPSPVRGS